MTKAPLRAVQPGEKAKPSRPLTITGAATAGDSRSMLVALRDRIAKTVEDTKCPPRDLAALSRRLIEIQKEIESIDARLAEESADADEAAPDEEWSAI